MSGSNASEKTEQAELWFLVANCSTELEAERIARAWVEQGLAKCVNISAPMRSVYVWEGAIEEECELRLMAKLPRARLEEATRLIKQLHGFDVPAIYGWPVAYASEDYRKYHLGEEM